MRLIRPLALAACTAVLFGALLWGVTEAQSGDAATPDATPTPLPAEPEPSAYLTLDMAAGFALDPFLVSLNGGGEVDASTIHSDCVGYINDQPVLTANWEGTVDALRVFFYSDSDSTLVIQQPDGSYLCNDDLADNVLDPEIAVTQPVTGVYKLWVGSYDANQLIPGLLVITARPDFGLAEFDPATLVKRAPIAPEPEVTAPAVVDASAALAAKAAVTDTAELAAAESAAAELAAAITADAVITDGATVTATLIAGGVVPSFEVSGDEAVCGGMIADVPDFILDVPAGLPNLRLMFEAEQDTSLVVLHAEGTFCADDNADLTNANPVLDIPAPTSGIYDVFVGRFQEDAPITGTLTVTTDPALAPAILAPASTTQP